jgi:hypothetical protein
LLFRLPRLPAFTADRAAFVPFYGVIPNGPVKESSMRSVCAIAQALGRVKMSAPLQTVWGLAEAEGLVLQNDSWVAGVGEHSRW